MMIGEDVGRSEEAYNRSLWSDRFKKRAASERYAVGGDGGCRIFASSSPWLAATTKTTEADERTIVP
jgi:hypothetical protein